MTSHKDTVELVKDFNHQHQEVLPPQYDDLYGQTHQQNEYSGATYYQHVTDGPTTSGQNEVIMETVECESKDEEQRWALPFAFFVCFCCCFPLGFAALMVAMWVCITSDEAEVNNRASMRVSWALSYVGLIFGILVWISVIATTVIMSLDE